MLRFAAWMIPIATMALGVEMVAGQDFPTRPIRIVTAAAGGGSDYIARLIAQGISAPLGQQVVVANYSSSVVPAETVAKAPPDGYTVLATGNTLWIGPLLQKASYDAIRDFAPITLSANAPSILVVHPSLPVRAVSELIVLAKARPGELNYAAQALGGPAFLAGELFKAMAGVDIVRVPYKSEALGISDLIGGQIQLTFGGAATVSPHIKSGRLRALAVTSARPSAVFPGLPTIAASGLPGYEAGLFSTIFAPAKTPATIINRLNQEIVRFVRSPEAKARFLSTGVEPVGNAPEELASFLKSDIATWSKIIIDTGIRGE